MGFDGTAWIQDAANVMLANGLSGVLRVPFERARRSTTVHGHDYVSAAARYGYISVLPEAPRSGNCFDVATPAALQRNGGGDRRIRAN